MGDTTHNDGTRVNLRPDADEGYVFVGWEGDIKGNRVIMDADKTVRAVFEAEEVELDVETVIPESPVEEVDDILDEDLPQGTMDDIQDQPLPQTSGLPLVAYAGIGLAVSGTGIRLRKKKK
jgi:hypothetical protein